MTEKEKFLIKHGYCEKEYTDCKHYDPEYPEFEYDKETGEGKRFRYVAIDMPDVEYMRLRSKFGEEKKQPTVFDNAKTTDTTNLTNVTSAQNTATSNAVAGALKAISVITYICGILAGLILLGDDVFSGLILIISGFISGSMFLGFAEIIKLLHEINEKTGQ